MSERLVREVVSNEADPRASTRSAPEPEVADSAASFEAAFVAGYPTVRAVCVRPNAPGVALFAVHAGGVASAALVAAAPDVPQTAIVGRHPEADVALVADPTVSLRHVAVVVHPLGEDRPFFRLIDLRTGLGMVDENGQRVEHVVADGPMFVRIGAYYLLVIPLNDQRVEWPTDPHEAWHKLPPRVFKAQRSAKATPAPALERPLSWGREAPADPNATIVQELPGPRFARPVKVVSPLRPPDGDVDSEVLGELLIASEDGASASVLVDRGTARSGLVLGRNERCDNAALPLLEDQRISRVHMMLLEVEGRVFAIDCASTNGVWQGGAHAGGTLLRYGQRLTIARGLAWVKWMKPPAFA